MQNTIAQAEALRAVNSAKHKSAGKTHRLEVKIYRGTRVERVAVIYVKSTNPSQAAVNFLRKQKSSVISDFAIQAL